MTYFDATGRRIPTNVSDPAVAYHLRMIEGCLATQTKEIAKLASATERVAYALERIAFQYAGPPPAFDQTEVVATK